MPGEHAGMSLIEQLWEQADAQYAKLRELHDEYGESSVLRTDYNNVQGKVQALAFSVGTILFPYDTPKERIDKVRPMLAERWTDNNPEEEDD